MRRKILSVLLTFTMAFSLILPAGIVSADQGAGWNAERYGDTKDIGIVMRAIEDNASARAAIDAQVAALEASEDAAEAVGTADDGNFTYNGGTRWFLASDNNSYYFKTFTLRSLGEKVEVWVADDISYQPGDPRPNPIVTQAQVDKLRSEFDNNIYQKDTEFFGMPDSHNGENNTIISAKRGIGPGYWKPEDGVERVVMLVDNVKDEQYYDPSYPFYVAGFFSPTLERYMDRNIITIDTNKWESRLESTYFGTVAHEFQHLIHSDNDSAEEKFINEGMSDFAEYLCGYGHAWGHVNYFLDHPENSLVAWDEYLNAETGPETLADYGQAYLFMTYLNDHYGRDLIQTLAKNKNHGIDSINEVLSQFGTGIDFNELFKRFTLALAIDDPKLEDGIYNFSSIDVKVNFTAALEHAKDGVPAWGADYLVINSPNKIKSLKFDGIDYLATPWKVVDDPVTKSGKVIWGNEGDERDNQAILKVDLTGASTATLKFDHYYSIEEQWDFGVVQVSADNGSTWTSLANGNTRSDVVDEGYPTIKENLPGFTGTNNTWTKESFDLSPYAGKNILINFRYMTDWGSNEAGWFVKNIEIPEIGFAVNCSTLDQFLSIDKIKGHTVDYAVSFINTRTVGKGKILNHVMNIDPFSITEQNAMQLKGFLNNGQNYMVVWYAARTGNKNPVEYSYDIQGKNTNHKAKPVKPGKKIK